jgi:thiaminase/transcriptional activator TenA
VADSSESVALWLWENTDDIWNEIQEHPFLVELEAGELPDEKLKFYFEQNAQYVDAVYRCRLVAAAKAPDEATFDLLTRDWNLEPSEDRQWRLLEMFGGDRDSCPPMAPACRGYTYHMWYNALAGRTVDWLASFVACPWTYDMIGRKISGNIGEERREDWMEFYGSQRHHDLMDDFRGALDRLSVGLDTKDREGLLENWRLGMKYEWMFWDDAYHLRGWPV